MALLPVRAVTVEARDGERTLLTVPFERAELQRVRFGFIDRRTSSAGAAASSSKNFQKTEAVSTG